MGKTILMLTHEFPPFKGGIGTYASQLALAAHQLGHDVMVVAPDHGQKCDESDRRKFPFKVRRYHGGHYSIRNLPRLFWRVWRHTGKNGYDIIHAVDWPHILAMAALNKRAEIPFISTVYGTDLLSSADCRQAKYLGVNGFFSRPKRVMAISQFTRSLYLEKCPDVRPDRVELTPLGVDESWFERGQDSRMIREKYGIPRNHKIIVTVARLDERKGHRVALKGLRQLPDDIKSGLAYVVVGTTDDESYLRVLKELASLSGVEVHFVGSVDTSELKALYTQADFFCMPGEPHPKKVEGFGLAYLEAAAQGLPSIAGRIGAIPEVVIDGETGILVQPMDIDGIARAMEKLLRNDGLRRSLGESARTNARKFTWRRCAELTYGVE